MGSATLRDTAWAMSEDNIEALKRAIEANNRHDHEAFLEEFDPDIEWHAIFGVGEATVVRGHQGLLEYFGDLDEGFAQRYVEATEFRDLVRTLGGRGSTTGTPSR